MSFYSDRSLSALLQILPGELGSSRNRLEKLGLIAWEAPFYQVLDLDDDGEQNAVQASRQPVIQPIPATTEQVSAILQNFLTKAGQL